jgi:hypothetical protein
MIHPLVFIERKYYGPVFLFLLVLTLTTGFILQFQGDVLKNPVAPGGIVSLEFAGTIEKSDLIIRSWKEAGTTAAAFNIGLDYLFLFLYPLAILAGCIWVTGNQHTRSVWIKNAGYLVSWLVIGAGILDAIENIALYRLVTGASESFLPRIALYCAVPKFLLTGLGILYFLTTGLYLLFQYLYGKAIRSSGP